MRRLNLVAIAALALAAGLAGCGARGVVSPTPVTVVGALPKPALEPETPAFKLKGDPVAGRKVFLTAGCTGCHTLKDAGSTGNVGPNLDQLKPAFAVVKRQVENGGAAMPAFKATLSAKRDAASMVRARRGVRAV